jgi:glutamine synthetase
MDSRQILKRATEKCAALGFVCMIGAECEFYLFKTDENGAPTSITVDKGGYLDIAPLDKSEDIRREISLTLEEIGIKPETSHHEQGPGQNEIDFKYSDALSSADNLISFKTMVRKIAARNGLFASFLPKPIKNAAGSGLHVNLSLSQMGKNIFKSNGEHSKIAESFIAGILAKTREMTLFLNPLANSYERFGAYEAPKYVSWSHRNRSQLVRIPTATGEKVRMELRSPDPSINPYLAFALILEAGLEGIEQKLTLPPEVNADLYSAPQEITNSLEQLPQSLSEAMELARNSEFVRRVVGSELLDSFLKIKETETKFTSEDYFEFV